MLLHDKRYHVTVICLSLRLRQITQTSALIIPHILLGLNNLIVMVHVLMSVTYCNRLYLNKYFFWQYLTIIR